MTNEVRKLVDDLKRLGVAGGSIVMLHASLRALGCARSQGVERGAEQLLDAVTEVLGPTGTLLMVLGTESPNEWVNEQPVAERSRLLLERGVPYDPRTAPVLPEVGWVAEAFRQRAGTLVSSNPSGRFAACGARAAELLRDQPHDDYYGPGSPLDKLCAAGGHVLRLGAGADTTTVLHYAEYLAEIPDKRRTRWDYVVHGPAGPQHVFVQCLDDANGIVAWEGDDYFALILGQYLALGRHRAGRVGQAPSELIDAKDLVRFGATWMEANLRACPAPATSA